MIGIEIAPTYICNDLNVRAISFLQENENLINVHTILKENRDKWEKEFVDDDDEISNDYM